MNVNLTFYRSSVIINIPSSFLPCILWHIHHLLPHSYSLHVSYVLQYNNTTKITSCPFPLSPSLIFTFCLLQTYIAVCRAPSGVSYYQFLLTFQGRIVPIFFSLFFWPKCQTGVPSPVTRPWMLRAKRNTKFLYWNSFLLLTSMTVS